MNLVRRWKERREIRRAYRYAESMMLQSDGGRRVFVVPKREKRVKEILQRVYGLNAVDVQGDMVRFWRNGAL